MKILHITETMVSGVLKYIHEVILAGSEDEVEHFIIYSPHRLNTPNNLKEQFPTTVSLIELDFNLNYKFLKTLRDLYKQISIINPDVIHLHSSIAGLFGRIITRWFPKAKVFYTPHGYSFLMTNKSIITRSIFWLVEFLLSQLNGQVIACSRSEFRLAKKLSLFHTPFLLENSIKVGPNLNNSEKVINIVGVGRLEYQKNPTLFIEIVSELKQINPNINAVWIGDGSLRKECELLNQKLKADVHFAGWLSNTETIEVLKRSKVFLQTSRWEGLPYSILEALSVGLSVVASDIESHRDLLEFKYLGFIAKDKEQYTKHIFELISNQELCFHIAQENHYRLLDAYTTFSGTLYSIYNREKFM